jgi:hypothetical protein
MNRYGFWPDIRLFSVSDIRPGTPANQIRYGIRPETGYQKWPNYPAGYPVHPYP